MKSRPVSFIRDLHEALGRKSHLNDPRLVLHLALQSRLPRTLQDPLLQILHPRLGTNSLAELDKLALLVEFERLASMSTTHVAAASNSC